MSEEDGAPGDDEGIRAGVEESTGDPRVVLAMNAVLSAWFAWVVVWGLDFLGFITLTLQNVATLALILFALTYVAVLR
ncbi:hypothetical protein CK500_09570 [Halorubrum salipaludis]|uniref:DUF8107 domain-containing protein n=1 Tax=Halorubrum salipaludis TaxID=2032630 RepID=A0A2A2FGR0_9EURY|nr:MULTISPECIES: hypothetical protein [Halorubrum]PAU83745.1 hypothetical protein CK500_09570 [Halorubrum salipaludis]